MKIPFSDLDAQIQAYRADFNKAIEEVLDSGRFINGPWVGELETQLGEFVGTEHCVTCASGTDALLLCLKALDLELGDEVIVPAFSFIATAEVVLLSGAIPVFVDVEEKSFGLDPNLLEGVITSRTRAILAVSLFGQTCNLRNISRVAKTHDLVVIEDAAQSLGARNRDGFSGGQTQLAATSFFPSKPLGCFGDGGAVFCNRDETAAKLRLVKSHGELPPKAQGESRTYTHVMAGMNSRLDSVQAAILLVKLRYFPQEVTQRQRVALRYFDGLESLEALGLPELEPDQSSVWAQFTCRTPLRDQLREHLSSLGIPTAVHYPKPLPEQPVFKSPLRSAFFPRAKKLCYEVLSLPMSAFLSESHQSSIIQAIQEFFNERSLT